jgi:hypothetical protein
MLPFAPPHLFIFHCCWFKTTSDKVNNIERYKKLVNLNWRKLIFCCFSGTFRNKKSLLFNTETKQNNRPNKVGWFVFALAFLFFTIVGFYMLFFLT